MGDKMKNNTRRVAILFLTTLMVIMALLSLTMIACKKTQTQTYVIAFSTENASHGSVSGSCESGAKVELGKTVTLTATPSDEGYEFLGWYSQGELKASANPYEFEVMEDVTLVAKFKELWHHHNYKHLTYAMEDNTVYQIAKCECSQTQKTAFSDYTFIDNIYDLLQALEKKGEKDRLLVLDNGYPFGRIEINDLNHFDENITIMGKEGTIIDGIMINSGKGSENANKLTDVMPAGITIIGIEFTDDLHVVNCSTDRLTIKDCTFVDGAGINIRANSYDGLDEVNARPVSQINTISNTTIENCTFTTYSNKVNKTKINLYDVNGVTIKNNNISGCDYNAIQINNRSLDGIYGNIVIEGNDIRDTYSRAIRFTNIKGDVTIKNNAFSYIDGSKENNGEVIKANSTAETSLIVFEGNTLDGLPIEVDSEKVVWQKSVLDN